MRFTSLSADDLRKSLLFACWGAAGGLAGAALAEIFVSRPPENAATIGATVASTGLWFGAYGLCVALALTVAQDRYLRKPVAPSPRIALMAAVGLAAGLVAGALAQAVYALGPNEALRVVCWGIAGGLLGAGLSLRIPNLSWRRGALGGGLGGALGGVAFVAIGTIVAGAAGVDWPSRFAGLTVIGFLLGLMLLLTEAALKEAWLEVAYGPKERRTVGLGASEVVVGNDPAGATVFVASATPVAVAFRLRNGRVEAEDRVARRTETIQPGGQLQIGPVLVTVRAAGQPATAGAAGPSRPAAGGLVLHLAGGAELPIGSGAAFAARDLPTLEPGGADGVCARVSTHPSDPRLLGLTNHARRAWTVSLPGGEQRRIEPGRTVRLAPGTRIDFGGLQGDVRGA